MAVSEVNILGFNVPQQVADMTNTSVTRTRHRQISEFAQDNGMKIYQAYDALLQLGITSFNAPERKAEALESQMAELADQIKKLRSES